MKWIYFWEMFLSWSHCELLMKSLPKFMVCLALFGPQCRVVLPALPYSYRLNQCQVLPPMWQCCRRRPHAADSQPTSHTVFSNFMVAGGAAPPPPLVKADRIPIIDNVKLLLSTINHSSSCRNSPLFQQVSLPQKNTRN